MAIACRLQLYSLGVPWAACGLSSRRISTEVVSHVRQWRATRRCAALWALDAALGGPARAIPAAWPDHASMPSPKELPSVGGRYRTSPPCPLRPPRTICEPTDAGTRRFPTATGTGFGELAGERLGRFELVAESSPDLAEPVPPAATTWRSSRKAFFRGQLCRAGSVSIVLGQHQQEASAYPGANKDIGIARHAFI